MGRASYRKLTASKCERPGLEESNALALLRPREVPDIRAARRKWTDYANRQWSTWTGRTRDGPAIHDAGERRAVADEQSRPTAVGALQQVECTIVGADNGTFCH